MYNPILSDTGDIDTMKEKILKRLQDEIDRLKYEMNVELPQEIGRAREHGDLRENAEYHAAKERQSFVKARLDQLSVQMAQLSILDFSRIPKDKVGLGSQVKVLDLDSDEEIEYLLVIAEEADASAGKISAASPIGRGLVNSQVGDEIEVKVPSGTRAFEVLSFKTIYDEFTG
jgi:transcription elongation factor GreA